jgi:hypothetical protein
MEQIVAQATKTFFLTPERPSVTALHRVVSSEMQESRSSPCRSQGCSRLLRILGPEQADALLARAQRWPPYLRMRMMQAK